MSALRLRPVLGRMAAPALVVNMDSSSSSASTTTTVTAEPVPSIDYTPTLEAGFIAFSLIVGVVAGLIASRLICWWRW